MRTLVFIGPPHDKNLDSQFTKHMLTENTRKIICGGTTALIAERELKRQLYINPYSENKNIPPTGFMDGFDLITEGVVTLQGCLLHIQNHIKNEHYLYDETIKNLPNNLIKENNNISHNSIAHIIENSKSADILLSKMLLEADDIIEFYVGTAQNPANKDLIFKNKCKDKFILINEIINELTKLDKKINITYF